MEGPNPDGANFYWFTSRAEGDVSCTGKMAQIGVTVVFHHSTNGQQGTLTGATRICNDKAECTGRADYRRQRLYCREVYHYDDYAQATDWFKASARRTTRQRAAVARRCMSESYGWFTYGRNPSGKVGDWTITRTLDDPPIVVWRVVSIR